MNCIIPAVFISRDDVLQIAILKESTTQSNFSALHLKNMNVTIYFTLHKQSLSKTTCLQITGFLNDAVFLVTFTYVSTSTTQHGVISQITTIRQQF